MNIFAERNCSFLLIKQPTNQGFRKALQFHGYTAAKNSRPGMQALLSGSIKQICKKPGGVALITETYLTGRYAWITIHVSAIGRG
jgi:hypothetical protein